MEVTKTKKCGNCGAEIPITAAYCDVCGERFSMVREAKTKEEKKLSTQKKERRLRIVKRILTTLVVAFMILFTLSLIMGKLNTMRFERREKLRDLSKWETVVSKSDFEKIDVGMTYDEIVEIVGGPGKKVEDDKYRIAYMWPGEYYIDSFQGCFEVEFSKYDLEKKKNETPASMIRERGMIDGAETFEMYKAVRDGRFAEIDTEIVTKSQVEKISEGMSYEKVCEILGDGKLFESESWVNSYDSTNYKTYVWRCTYQEEDFCFQLRFENGILKYLSEWMVNYVD